MATIRAYTTIEQSRKLAEILPLENADMYYMEVSCNNYIIGVLQRLEKDMLLKQAEYYKMLPCWSLAALLSVIRETIGYTIYGVNNVYMSCNLGDEPWKLETKVYDNEIDACVEMIIKLHKINLL